MWGGCDAQTTLARGMGSAGCPGPQGHFTLARQRAPVDTPCLGRICSPAQAQAFADVASAEAQPDPVGLASVFKHHELTGDLFFRLLSIFPTGL